MGRWSDEARSHEMVVQLGYHANNDQRFEIDTLIVDDRAQLEFSKSDARWRQPGNCLFLLEKKDRLVKCWWNIQILHDNFTFLPSLVDRSQQAEDDGSNPMSQTQGHRGRLYLLSRKKDFAWIRAFFQIVEMYLFYTLFPFLLMIWSPESPELF